MTIKERVLTLFESNRGVYFSVEEIAQILSIPCTTVGKAIKALQMNGYSIDLIMNKGYCLSNQVDCLSVQGIKQYLSSSIINLDISILETIDSTNTYVCEKANEGALEGYLVLANEQTCGKGRVGKSFFSPKGTGIYMSLLLRPKDFSSKQVSSITTMAAVAVCEAIEEVSKEKAEIKWVNDIFVHGKKVCGILTESAFDLESGSIDYVVLGIGINVYEPENGVPQELKSIIGAIFQSYQWDVKNRLVAEIINCFYHYYDLSNSNDYVEKYRQRNFIIGKEITIVSANQSRNATVLGIDDHCRLFVKYEDGTKEYCSCGEISVRL